MDERRIWYQYSGMDLMGETESAAPLCSFGGIGSQCATEQCAQHPITLMVESRNDLVARMCTPMQCACIKTIYLMTLLLYTRRCCTWRRQPVPSPPWQVKYCAHTLKTRVESLWRSNVLCSGGERQQTTGQTTFCRENAAPWHSLSQHSTARTSG